MRLSVQIALFLILLNAFATAMTADASGVNNVLGVEPTVGGDTAINQSENAADADSVSGSGVVGAVDLAAFVVSGAFAVFETIKSLTVGGPLMLSNAGFPGWLVTLIFAPMYLVVFVDLFGLVKSGD